MTIKYYNTLAEKRQLKIDAYSRKESTIHDDFIDKQNNLTDGSMGKLTFDIKPDPPHVSRWQKFKALFGR